MDRKLISLALSIAVIAASAAAQTNTFPASGNVGIGTTSPASILDVNGTLTVSNAGWINMGPATMINSTSGLLQLGAYGGVGVTVTNTGLDVTNGMLAVTATKAPWNEYEMMVAPTFNGTLANGYVDTMLYLLPQSGTLTNNGTVVGLSVDMSAVNGTKYAALFQSGNVGIGTTNPGAALEVNGNVKLTSGSGASITFADGTVQSSAYTGVVCGGDYAESMDVGNDRTQYGPGDILVLDPNHPGKVLKSIEPYSSAVSGIFSTKPGTVGRRQLTPKSETEVPMAMVGVVPTKVTAENGVISVGDLLVSSSKPGYPMKGTDRSRMLGAVIGKAMSSLHSGTGIIEVLVTLQ